MKQLPYKVLVLTLCMVTGCTQVIITPDEIKINTLFENPTITPDKYIGASPDVGIWTPWGILRAKENE